MQHNATLIYSMYSKANTCNTQFFILKYENPITHTPIPFLQVNCGTYGVPVCHWKQCAHGTRLRLFSCTTVQGTRLDLGVKLQHCCIFNWFVKYCTWSKGPDLLNNVTPLICRLIHWTEQGGEKTVTFGSLLLFTTLTLMWHCKLKLFFLWVATNNCNMIVWQDFNQSFHLFTALSVSMRHFFPPTPVALTWCYFQVHAVCFASF